MDSLVAQIAVAVVPHPVPVVVQTVARERLDLRGTGPEVVVNRRGNRIVPFGANRAAALVAQSAGQFDFADPSTLNEFHQLAHAGVGAALHARLADPLVLARGLNEPPA